MSELQYEVCPVCGYKEHEAFGEFDICDCCGTEFEGWQDAEWFAAVRQEWIDGGMRWWFEYGSPPENWNPAEQLERLEIRVTPPCERGA